MSTPFRNVSAGAAVIPGRFSETDPTPGYFGRQIVSFGAGQGLWRWDLELSCRVDGSEPETEFVGEEVAGALCTLALNERFRAEILET